MAALPAWVTPRGEGPDTAPPTRRARTRTPTARARANRTCTPLMARFALVPRTSGAGCRRGGHGGVVGLPRASGWLERAADHGGERLEQDHDIAPQGPVLDVLVVETGTFVDGGVAPQPVDLGQSRETGRRPVPSLVARHLGPELLDEEGALRTWADQRHVALQDVPQLGELVQPRQPEDSTDAGHRLVGGAPLDVGSRVDPHRPELEDLDRRRRALPPAAGGSGPGPDW